MKKTYSSHGLSDEVIAEVNRISTLNYLRYVNGKISQMKPVQKKRMEMFGIIKRKPRKDGKIEKWVKTSGVFVFTEKGKKLLEEMRNE